MHETTQDSSQSASETPKKRRTQAEKVGYNKYVLQRLDQIQRVLTTLNARQRFMEKGLEDFMEFDKDYLVNFVCRDGFDENILQRLFEVGDNGLLPSELAASLNTRLKRWDVTRRIQCMNKKLEKEFGLKVAEKRGHHWAMSSFMRSAYNSTIKEAREEQEAKSLEER